MDRQLTTGQPLTILMDMCWVLGPQPGTFLGLLSRPSGLVRWNWGTYSLDHLSGSPAGACLRLLPRSQLHFCFFFLLLRSCPPCAHHMPTYPATVFRLSTLHSIHAHPCPSHAHQCPSFQKVQTNQPMFFYLQSPLGAAPDPEGHREMRVPRLPGTLSPEGPLVCGTLFTFAL